MSETILPVLSRGVGDRSTGPRIAIARLSAFVIAKRIKARMWYPSSTPLGAMLTPTNSSELATSQQAAESFAASVSNEVPSSVVDTELLTDLVLLLGDPDETVRSTSQQVGILVCQSLIRII